MTIDDHLRRYRERQQRCGEIGIFPVLPEEDGGTGDRWGATWAPDGDVLPELDASAPTLELALIYLAYGLGQEVNEARERDAERARTAIEERR